MQGNKLDDRCQMTDDRNDFQMSILDGRLFSINRLFCPRLSVISHHLRRRFH